MSKNIECPSLLAKRFDPAKNQKGALVEKSRKVTKIPKREINLLFLNKSQDFRYSDENADIACWDRWKRFFSNIGLLAKTEFGYNIKNSDIAQCF